jgi:hypothetical protein
MTTPPAIINTFLPCGVDKTIKSFFEVLFKSFFTESKEDPICSITLRVSDGHT